MHVELELLMQTWNDAWLKKDADTVAALMAPEYGYVAPTGQVVDRAAILAIIKSPSYQLDRGTRTEVKIAPIGRDSAIIVDRWRGTGSYEGRSFTDDHRCTTVCVWRGGAWQIAWEHCSTIAP
jgi:uncharacterized protein (TIGR02246 family)